MEPYRLSSRIVENEKEFLVQTLNDEKQGIIRSSLFVNGELLDSVILPHSEETSEAEILNLVKSTHGQKTSELEYLLKNYKEIMEQGNPETMYQLGTALYYKRMYPESRDLLRTAVSLDPNHHKAWLNLSLVESALKNASEAVRSASKAVELRDKFADYRNILGELYLEAGSCKRAIIELDEAIKLNVYYADAYYNLALTNIYNGISREDYTMFSDLTPKALDMLQKATLIDPGFRSQAYDSGIAALNGGNLKEAYGYLKQARNDKKERKRREQAVYYDRFLMSSDWASQAVLTDRIRFLERELEKNPGYVDLLHELGICHLQKAKLDWQKGVEYLQNALGVNGDLKKTLWAKKLADEEYLRISDTVTDISEKNE
jgi:tetratricopeptide (TPR) repeat protein